MSELTFSVSQINNYIKNIIDAEAMLENVLVLGEISSYSVTRGIAYFNIKDETGILPCVLFSAERFGAVKIGDMVLLRGSVKYYSKGGRLSFNAQSLQQYGQGLLYQKFLQLKEKLENEGYFEANRKKTLPLNIQRIGVITSKTGAVLQDIINVVTRRNPSVDIVLYDVSVQGNYAKNQIIEGINFFSNYDKVDVIVVARGGGSIEDLQPFNEEDVAMATVNCNKPIVSAVGHETDFTIIDFVSDLRAPTPSAAAELLTINIIQIKDELKKKSENLSKLINNKLSVQNNLVKLEIDRFKSKLDSYLILKSNLIEKNITLLNTNFDNKIGEINYNLGMLINSLDKLNPLNILKKGYTKLILNNNDIYSVKELTVGDEVNFRLTDGKVDATITKIIGD